MRRTRSTAVNILLRMLDPVDRVVVDGDLRELRLPRNRAIRELLGLLFRRQVAAWLDWRPWAAIGFVVLPLGVLISVVTRQWALGAAIYAWLYAGNWTPMHLASAGARTNLLHIMIDVFLLKSVALMLWAWTAGFVIASVSRRAAWVTYVLFGLILFSATAGSTSAALRNPGNSAVFSQTLYRVGFPIAFRIVFVLLPALHGVRKAAGGATLTWAQTLALVLSTALLTTLVAPGTEVAVTWGWWSSSGDGPAIPALFELRGTWQLRLLPFVMTLPAAYVFSTGSWRSWRRTQP
jgi:hypothetical protein